MDSCCDGGQLQAARVHRAAALPESPMLAPLDELIFHNECTCRWTRHRKFARSIVGSHVTAISAHRRCAEQFSFQVYQTMCSVCKFSAVCRRAARKGSPSTRGDGVSTSLLILFLLDWVCGHRRMMSVDFEWRVGPDRRFHSCSGLSVLRRYCGEHVGYSLEALFFSCCCGLRACWSSTATSSSSPAAASLRSPSPTRRRHEFPSSSGP